MRLMEMVAAARGTDDEEELMAQQNRAFDGDIAKRIVDLKRLGGSYLSYESFKVGDIVRWKDGLRNRSFLYAEPMLIIELLELPVYDKEASAGSTIFCEPLDVRVGVLVEDGEFITFVIDRRRLELHDGSRKPHDEESIRKYNKIEGKSKPALSEEEVEAILKQVKEVA